MTQQGIRRRAVDFLDTGNAHPVGDCGVKVKYLTLKITSGPRGWGEFLSDAGTPFLRITNIPRRGIDLDLSDLVQIRAPDGPERERTRTREGDVLISITADIGSVAVVDHRSVDGNVSQHVALVRPDPRICHSRWLAYAMKSNQVNEVLTTNAYGGTKVGLGLGDVGDIVVPRISLEEQRRIADFLDAETARINRITDVNRRLLERLTERRTAAVIEEVAGGRHRHRQRRQSTLAWLESLPAAWDEVRVGLLARMGSGHTPSRSRPDWWQGCSIPWITTGEVQQVRDDRTEEIFETREKISEIGLENSAAELHPKGTVVLCRTASAGYSAVMGTDMATSQDFVTWTCGPRLDPFYLLWCLRAMRQDLLGRLAMGSTHKTIYVPDLQALRIPLPPSRVEQGNIVQRIREDNAHTDRLMDKVKQQIALLAERQQALITAAVTGQFDVSTASGRGVTE